MCNCLIVLSEITCGAYILPHTPFSLKFLAINDLCFLYYQHLSFNTCDMVQLKGNLIPTRVLQVEYCWVKITSCVQYLNGHPLRSCPHQANCLVCAPANVTLILNDLLNETYSITSIYTMNLRILSLYILFDP